MSYYIAEIRLNKRKSENSEKSKKRRRLITGLTTLALIALLISAPVTLFSTTVAAAEPPLESVLNDLGFTNIALAHVGTFPAGTYNVTLMAEFASYNPLNELSYYAVETTDYQTIFAGLEGATGYWGGCIVPPITKTVTIGTEFGLSMISPEHRYYTEHYLNPDYPEEHAKVYSNLDVPGMFLIGFENKYGGFDRDYNDMIFSLMGASPLEIDSVTRAPESPNYDQAVTVTAQVTKGTADIDSVIHSYQSESASWINVTMSMDDGSYVADIPAQPYGTTVNYKVYANDTMGNSVVSGLFSYVVGDFVSPVISNVVQVPSSPAPNDAVTVSATVTEPAEASGVKNVTLWYTMDAVWSSVEMALQGGSWKATIPEQNEGVYVTFFVEAFDNAENNARTSNFGYTITVPNRPPVAVLLYSPAIVYTGVDVDFDASSSYDIDGTVVSYLWDFGDGTTSTETTLTHSYADNGEYQVVLNVVDNEGAVGSKVAIQVVKNRPPVAVFTESATDLAKQETATFDANLSYDVDGTIVKYSWDFGDGNSATGVSVGHAYQDSGVYTVTLTVTDNDGATDSTTATKNVVNRPPVAVFTESSETGYAGDTFTFDAAGSYDPDGTIVSYAWNFGDGNTATGATTDHKYADNGAYTVTLTVTDNDGAKDSAYSTTVVMNMPPTAEFTASAESVHADETVSFDASGSSDPDGTIVRYAWDFGDGITATGATADHAYSGVGAYTVTLTVTDDDGATDSTTATVTVLNVAPVASFTESAETVSTGENVQFDASASYDTDGIIVSYAWNFGDGNTATGATADHAYADNGAYTVTLTVTDNNGATGLATATENVLNRVPVAEFTENVTTVAQNEAIHFDASASYDTDGTIVSYAWDFGDGNTGTGVTVDHAYSEDGEFTVTLTVTDDDGASSSAVAETSVESEAVMQLAVLSVIGLGITALTATLLYGLFIRRKKKKKNGDD